MPVRPGLTRAACNQMSPSHTAWITPCTSLFPSPTSDTSSITHKSDKTTIDSDLSDSTQYKFHYICLVRDQFCNKVANMLGAKSGCTQKSVHSLFLNAIASTLLKVHFRPKKGLKCVANLLQTCSKPGCG